jgi:hypothetical protein
MTDPTDPTDPIEPREPTAPVGSAGPTEPARPAIPAPEDDRVAVLAVYLRTNRGRFTEEALARAARDVGYSEAEIRDAATIAVPGSQAEGIPSAAGGRLNAGVAAAAAIGYVIALYGAIWLVGAARILTSSASDFSGAVALAGLLAGVVAWALLRNDRPSLARGIGCGVVLAISIPIVTILVIIGICIATGSSPGF